MGLTMATLTKKELLEAIEDMPMDAGILAELFDHPVFIEKIVYNKELNVIVLC